MAPACAASDANTTPEKRVNLAQVLTEISAEAAAFRAAGDFSVEEERNLNRVFEEESPVMSHQALAEALRQVDEASFLDPLVPVDSNRPGGAGIKRGMRSMTLWYVGWLIRQISQFAVATSRSLHVIERRLNELDAQVQARGPVSRSEPGPGHTLAAVTVVEFPDLHRPDAWWVGPALHAVEAVPGPVLQIGGSLVGWGAGADAVPAGEMSARLQAREPSQLGAVVLTGVVDGMDARQRDQLLELMDERLVDGGTLVVHSVTRSTWARDDAPAAADLAPGRPLRSESWRSFLGDRYDVSIREGPGGADYLVVAQRTVR